MRNFTMCCKMLYSMVLLVILVMPVGCGGAGADESDAVTDEAALKKQLDDVAAEERAHLQNEQKNK